MPGPKITEYTKITETLKVTEDSKADSSATVKSKIMPAVYTFDNFLTIDNS